MQLREETLLYLHIHLLTSISTYTCTMALPIFHPAGRGCLFVCLLLLLLLLLGYGRGRRVRMECVRGNNVCAVFFFLTKNKANNNFITIFWEYCYKIILATYLLAISPFIIFYDMITALSWLRVLYLPRVYHLKVLLLLFFKCAPWFSYPFLFENLSNFLLFSFLVLSIFTFCKFIQLSKDCYLVVPFPITDLGGYNPLPEVS